MSQEKNPEMKKLQAKIEANLEKLGGKEAVAVMRFADFLTDTMEYLDCDMFTVLKMVAEGCGVQLCSEGKLPAELHESLNNGYEKLKKTRN